MGKYLDLLARPEPIQSYDINDIHDQTPHSGCAEQSSDNQQYGFGRKGRLCRTLTELERRCPDHIEPARWQQAIEDGRRFLAQWGEQAEALDWTARDLFGLHEVPTNPAPSYQRLSRYDQTGLLWLLQGCPVAELTEATATIRMPTGATLNYRRFNKPAYGPVGDSTDDFVA
jgi:hypothetical protein